MLRSSDTEEELDQQLHSSVRTANLETSLRLLAQGADPNYFHEVSYILFIFREKKVLKITVWPLAQPSWL